jgi:copper chaperone
MLSREIRGRFRKESVLMAMIETTLSVPDVSCQHCVKTINGALGVVEGVAQVNTDIPSKTVSLQYDPSKVSMEKIEEILDEAGYTVAK